MVNYKFSVEISFKMVKNLSLLTCALVFEKYIQKNSNL